MLLESIRKRSSSIVVKVLFGLLIVSFAAWGVGDMIRGFGGDAAAATVGRHEISAQQVSVETHREMERLRGLMGKSLTQEQAKNMGVPRMVLGRIVDRVLIGLGADQLGVIASDAMVREAIHGERAFRGKDGQFDRDAFQQVLYANGFSEEQFVNFLRGDLTRAQVLDTLGSAGSLPKAEVDLLYRFRHQRRKVALLRFGDEAAPIPPAPEDAVLEAFHQSHAQAFSAPEYRRASAVVLAADDLVKEVSVSASEIKEAYDRRHDEFSTPERRKLQQILLSDRAKAEAAHKQIEGGKDFLAVAKAEAGMEAADADLGLVGRDGLLPELADAVFQLPAGGVSRPIETPLGWHVIRVGEIQPARTRTLDEAKDELTQGAAREKAVDALYKLANRVEDALAGGSTLEEAARTFNLRLVNVPAIDAEGKDANGKPVPDLPGGKVFVETAFRTEANRDSPLTETGDDGYFLIRVDAVTPAALRPFEAVKAEVFKAWQKEERRAWADKAAAAAKDRLADPAVEAAAVASEAKGDLIETDFFTRSGEGAPGDFPDAMVQTVFAAKKGEVVTSRGEGATFVARLVAISDPDPAGDENGRKRVTDDAARALRDDLLVQYVGALRRQHPVSVNARVLEQLF